MKKLTDTQLKHFLKDTLIKGEDGKPLVVYRGEHGEIEADQSALQTLLGTYSFGGSEIASTYATSPNNTEMVAHQPRVYPAYLRIRNPFAHNPEHPDDPFVDFKYMEKTLGRELAVTFFLKHANNAENTNNWLDEINEDDDFTGIEDFYQQHPERMGELYAELYPFLDDVEFVTALKEKGFDGAICGGTGDNTLEVEYRVFDANNVVFALSREIAAAPTKDKRLEPAEMSI